jgi:hypothetical protein
MSAGSKEVLDPDAVPGAYASDLATGDTDQLLAEGEAVGTWSEDQDRDEVSDEDTDDDMDDRSMRAHGSDRAADGQHGLSGGSKEPGSGPRHE